MFELKDDGERKKVISQIVDIEWDMFQKVQNIGGRTGCQNDSETFNIMRYSQYASWNDLMLESYKKDLEDAIKVGRNLVMEKYAFMMEFTEPDYYKTQLEPYLPKIDVECMKIIEEIVGYTVNCGNEIVEKYPKLSKTGRPIEASTDKVGYTSVETYGKSELRTYSKETLKLYLEHIKEAKATGKNLSLLVQDSMVKMYGYASIEEAEKKL